VLLLYQLHVPTCRGAGLHRLAAKAAAAGPSAASRQGGRAAGAEAQGPQGSRRSGGAGAIICHLPLFDISLVVLRCAGHGHGGCLCITCSCIFVPLPSAALDRPAGPPPPPGSAPIAHGPCTRARPGPHPHPHSHPRGHQNQNKSTDPPPYICYIYDLPNHLPTFFCDFFFQYVFGHFSVRGIQKCQ
jgi:hypothetical protein